MNEEEREKKTPAIRIKYISYAYTAIAIASLVSYSVVVDMHCTLAACH